MACFTWILLTAAAIFLIATLIRWLEQIAEAVRLRWWNKLVLLIVFPFAVWFFPSSVSAGRPVPVPRHEPVRGFGTAPTPKATVAPAAPPSPSEPPLADLAPDDQPPPGTPPEFLGLPGVPPPQPKSTKPAVDPDKVARLKEKMREQGMLDDEQS